MANCESCRSLIASGYKIAFVPNDQQLIVDYLYNKACGNPLPSDEAIIQCNIYGECHSWQKHFEQKKGETVLYFFTELKRKSERGSRTERTTTCGATWRSQSDKPILDDKKRHIGCRRAFTFQTRNKTKRDDQDQGTTTTTPPSWVMYEFRLDGILLNDADRHRQNNDVVICRISKKNKKDDEETTSSMPAVCFCLQATFPSGYSMLFLPTYVQIILRYLLNKVNNCASNEAIPECDLYGRCCVWRNFFEENKGKQLLYFFTRLKKLSGNGTRFERKTDCGTWKGQKDNKIRSRDSQGDEVQIGSRRSLSFDLNECRCGDDHRRQHDHGSTSTSTTWTVDEYRLNGILCNMSNGEDYVLCRLKKKVRGKSNEDKDSAPTTVASSSTTARTSTDYDDNVVPGRVIIKTERVAEPCATALASSCAINNNISNTMTSNEIIFWQFADKLPNMSSLC